MSDPRTTDDIRKTLTEKLGACEVNKPAGLDDEELLELQRQTLELAQRWLYDLTRKRSTKGTGAALSIAQQLASRIDVSEDRKRIKQENKHSMGLREIKITYQDPDPRIVAKVKGADNDTATKDDSGEAE